jgi:aspartyl-tRNA(Asn)/glutamyl-tRNA(Gln) amidotransferase subunit A
MAATRREFVKSSVGLLAFSGLLSHASANGAPSDLTEYTIVDISALIREKKVSPVELTRAYLKRIEQYNPILNAYITIRGSEAIAEARVAEKEIASGNWRGPLHGIPVALKDNMDTAGILTTGGSALFADRIPAEDSEVAKRLKNAGAVLLGKLNMHEFAYGDTSGISHYGPVRNPWSPDVVPGGSSGGSACAVAARLCAAALGTDTGGSIRQPAAYCGVVGLKPTYGLVSIRGIIPLAETQDHVGPICKSVQDTAAMLQVLAGFDSGGIYSLRGDTPDYNSAFGRPTGQLRLGIPREFFYDELDPEIEKACADAIDVLSSITAGTEEIVLPLTEARVVPAESHAWHETLLSSSDNRELYQPRVLDRLLFGETVSAAEYIEARRQQTAVRHGLAHVFRDVDLLITPTSPDLPVSMAEGQNPSNPLAFSLRNTAPFDANGAPTISIPCGISKKGLPIGIQISGPTLGEIDVLTLAQRFETETQWHKKKPDLAWVEKELRGRAS